MTLGGEKPTKKLTKVSKTDYANGELERKSKGVDGAVHGDGLLLRK